jgi:hypothetical protein
MMYTTCSTHNGPNFWNAKLCSGDWAPFSLLAPLADRFQAYLKLNHARFDLTTLKAKLKVSYKLTLLTHVQKLRCEVRQRC